MDEGARTGPAADASMSRAPLAAFPTACGAPHTTLHLDPRGVVRVCCENRLQVLGRLTEQTLEEIWHGEPLAGLRRALEAGRLEAGCAGCSDGIRSGDRSRARAGFYDDTRIDSRAPRVPVRLELELTNTCNLQCVMCNGELSSAIRSQREHRPPLPTVYDDAFFDAVAELVPTLEHVSFQGGEPFLGRESMRMFEVLIAHGFTGRCHVTTNGTIVNDRVERVLRTLEVDVSISVDGVTRETVESIRVGASHEAVMANVGWFRSMAAERCTSVGLHYCLMPRNAHELRDFLVLADGLDLDVTVIEVARPLSMSVERLGADELGRLVDTFEAQDASGPPLERNAGTWRYHRARIARFAAAVANRPAVDHDPVVGIDRSGAVRRRRRWAREQMERWADQRGVHALELSAEETVLSGAPDLGDVLGMDLSSAVGAHVRELLGVAHARFGAIETTEVLAAPSGTEDRTVVFRGAQGPTTLRSILVSGVDGGNGLLLVGARDGRVTASGSPGAQEG